MTCFKKFPPWTLRCERETSLRTMNVRGEIIIMPFNQTKGRSAFSPTWLVVCEMQPMETASLILRGNFRAISKMV